ncbi:ThiF family adenylyltransferase [Cytobacillus purgationiresistens]|uniref:THIF-type NAD/FAD binding fold domain-containing protein n=1 Tax=Cytobacillus purgationiresistens TaxID=863449 RepID=A0ABU0AQB6_9BACI|nr:ThiF family adenylyltransferase [Cytobacillus purgationiresistens]MDQ0273507.1 hypothetical protein [Cytobacillus purgationiresistens]
MTINILEKQSRSENEYNGLYPFILQLGVGGTGSYLVQHIAQLLGTSKKRAAYVIADPDTIEEKNLGNQLFLSQEVGLKKADVLANRYSGAYGLDIGFYSDSYIECIEKLKSLFSMEYIDSSVGYKSLVLPIIIGCVDNNFTRKLLHEFFLENNCIYIDAGIESVTLPNVYLNRNQSEWTKEEQLAYQNSGWSGQVVTGLNLNLFKQNPVAYEYPDILEDDDEIRPSELSCTELSASEPQRIQVNKFAAMTIMNVLNEVVIENTISTHKTVFHVRKGYMRSTGVENQLLS